MKEKLLNPNLFLGLKSYYYPWFNEIVKGFRRGELSLLTGGTGSGKTTFLCQYSLDFAMKGLSTLFCSFELKNEMIL